MIIVPNLSNPFYSRIIDGIYASALRQNYRCILYQSQRNEFSAKSPLELVYDVKASGVILLDSITDKAILEELDSLVPVVQCAEYTEGCNVSYVSTDDRTAGRECVELMLSRGKERIALVNGPLSFKYARERRLGYLDALEAAGIPVYPNLIINLPELGFESAFSVVTQLLNSSNPPDACFAVSDILAAAAIKAAKRCNLRIPEDFGIVGYDNTYVSYICDPAITTISQPCYQMGFLACEVLYERMIDIQTPPKQMLLETEFIIRDTL